MNHKKSKNFLLTLISSCFLLYVLSILDFLSIGSNLYLQKSHNVSLENFNMMVFTTTTFISQIIFGGLSRLKGGICGGAIFESAPFTREIHAACDKASSSVTESLTNAYFCILISTFLFGLLSFLLGLFKLGSIFNYIPRTPLYGVMASIGLQLIKSGLEQIYVSNSNIIHISAVFTFFLVFLAYFLEKKFDGFIFFIPLYTFTVFVLFYLVFFISGFDLHWLRSNFLVPPLCKSSIKITDFFQYIDFSKLNTKIIRSLSYKIISLTFVNMIHITVNIPAFSSTMGISANLNEEFKVQGISNFLTSFFGFPTYFINCTSIYFNKSGGTTKWHSVLCGFFLLGLIFIGPMSRQFLPYILLAFIPIYIGGYFLITNLVDHIRIASFSDLSIILLSTIVGYFNPIFGLIAGCILQVIIVAIVNHSFVQKENAVDDFYKTVKPNFKVIKIDFMGCFLNKEKFKNILKLDDNFYNTISSNMSIMIDLRYCQYMDYEANDILLNATREMKRNVLVVGNPINFYKHRFENIHI